MCVRKKKSPEAILSGSSNRGVMTVEPPKPTQTAPKEELPTPGGSISRSVVACKQSATPQAVSKAAGSKIGSKETTTTSSVVHVTVEPARKMNAKRVIDTFRNPHDPHYKTIGPYMIPAAGKSWDSAKLLKTKDCEAELKKSRKGSRISAVQSVRSTQAESEVAEK